LAVAPTPLGRLQRSIIPRSWNNDKGDLLLRKSYDEGRGWEDVEGKAGDERGVEGKGGDLYMYL